MKKVLFALYYMNVGGVEKALLGMLDAMPRDLCEVHVALMAPLGGFMQYIPDWVHVHTIEPFYRNIGLIQRPLSTIAGNLMHGRTKAFGDLWAFTKSKLTGDKKYVVSRLLRGDDALSLEFDLAVSYASPHEYLDYYIGRHIRARKKAMWIHFDVSKAFNSRRSVMGAMADADRIFVVSETGRQIFNKKYPELASRTELFRNIISPSAIKRDSQQPSAFKRVDGALNIVTVGRLNREKGQDLAIEAIALLRQRGINAVLHLVGGGRTELQCRRLALDAGIDDYIRFYGTQVNPYPFMAGADLYLQPSLHEGYCITLAEAKVFDAPIVATDFTGAREQLAARSNAVVAADFTPEAIADAVIRAKDLAYVAGCDRDDKNDLDRLLEML